MKWIVLTLRYPVDSSNLLYLDRNAVLAFGVNLTDQGIRGSVVYTANPVAFFVMEDCQTVFKLLQENLDRPGM